MGITMNQERVDTSSFLQIKELKEKVKSLVSEVELHTDNAKFNIFDLSLNSSVCSDIVDDEIIYFSDTEFDDETNWLTNENGNGELVQDISKKVYFDIDDNRPDVTSLIRELELTSKRKSSSGYGQKSSIDSRTFTRPKKNATRSPLMNVLNATEGGRPKLQRHLTTTINPTPSLISKLEELSKNNNRPVSGDYGEANWEDGSEEGLAEICNSPAKSKTQNLPVSLIARLQELKKSNSSLKVSKVVEPTSLPNGRIQDDYLDNKNSAMMEDAMKVKAALEADFSGPQSISGFSDLFRSIPDYSSDDNESFLSLSNVSGFCDRLTMSTDQNTYSAIIKEMEEQEIRLFHRTVDDEKSADSKPFSPKTFSRSRNTDRSHVVEEKNDLNRTYEIIEDEAEEKTNCTYDMKDTGKHNIMNSTYDANKKSGLVNIILQSDVIKTLTPSNGLRMGNNINNNFNINNNNNNNNNHNNNNNKVRTSYDGTFVSSDKLNGTLDQNQLNALHSEKYSTKVFDSSFRKSDPGVPRLSSRRSNGKSSDYSEDDCMSTTSDKSSRSAESNFEFRTVEEFRDIVAQQNEKLTSTPITDQTSKFQFETLSPIRMEVGGGESRAYSSRGENPRRISASNHIEGAQKYGMPNLKQPLKVPQRELKLKPALIRPPQNFKRPLSSSRASSEPSVPQKIENCQSATSVPALRATKPTAVPSLTNVRLPSRASGIPRPPTRLKQPQIRVNYSKK